TSFNGHKQQRIDINADALYNEKQENLRVWLLKFLISKKPVPEWPRSSMLEMTSVHISSGLVLHQMTFDHNRSELEGIMPTKIELTLEQSQQGVSNDVLVTWLIANIEDEHHGTSVQEQNPSAISGFLSTEIVHLSWSTPRYLLTSHLKLLILNRWQSAPASDLKAVNKSPMQYHCDIYQNIRVILMYSNWKMEISAESGIKLRSCMSMLVKDTRSQDGIDVKDNDKGSKSRSQSMKEQAYNKEQRERPRPHELNDKSNLIDLIKECHQ
ncbi:hypothetical protein Tco_1382072, partial [Tanacetum coccineum]